MAIIAGFLDPDVAVCKENRWNCTFTITGDIPGGIPVPRLPDFSIPVNATGEGLPLEEIPFGEMARQLGSAFIIIPIIAILESVAIAKAFGKCAGHCHRHLLFPPAGGKTVDASQEMVALGVCNIIGSLFSSMPTTGSFSRCHKHPSSPRLQDRRQLRERREVPDGRPVHRGARSHLPRLADALLRLYT
jgi:sodium-independent sulfate anion transporter 11